MTYLPRSDAYYMEMIYATGKNAASLGGGFEANQSPEYIKTTAHDNPTIAAIWVSELRALDERGEIPQEWRDKVSGLVTQYTPFSDMVEANLLDTVSDLVAIPRYNFYTENEGDIVIENMVLDVSKNNMPRSIDLLWKPIGEPKYQLNRGVWGGDHKQFNLAEIAKKAANNLGRNTVGIPLETGLRGRGMR